MRGTANVLMSSLVEEHVTRCGRCRQVLIGAARAATVPDREPAAGGAEHWLTQRSARYLWQDAIGEGAMGVVYAAHDQLLDRKVAIKVVRGQCSGRGQRSAYRERVLAESRALARLAHPNVVAVHDAGIDGGEPFIVMEFIEGVTVRRWLQAQPRHWTDVLTVFDQALAGLSAVHRAGLTHRDIKPDNILIDADGLAKVSDFGLALPSTRLDTFETEDRGGPSAATRAGKTVGTPSYLAPELFDGAKADHRSDQFAVCVALYEALYGVRPFEGWTAAALAEAVRRPPRRPPNRLMIPAAVWRVVRRGLATAPEARFVSVDALALALRRARAKPRRRRTIAASCFATALLGGCLSYAVSPILT